MTVTAGTPEPTVSKPPYSVVKVWFSRDNQLRAVTKNSSIHGFLDVEPYFLQNGAFVDINGIDAQVFLQRNPDGFQLIIQGTTTELNMGIRITNVDDINIIGTGGTVIMKPIFPKGEPLETPFKVGYWVDPTLRIGG